jgi:arylsulfate sulfotransferase
MLCCIPVSRLLALPLLMLAVSFGVAETPITLHLQTTLPSPQPVGTPIGLATMIGMESFSRDTFVFQYSVSVNGGPFRIVQDYSQSFAFAWTPELFEQSATIRVKVRNNETKATGEATVPFQFVSRVKGTAQVVTPTAHPLVALFSAAPCPVEKQFRVAFHADGEEAISRTPIQPCKGSISNNVYVAGMRADTEYRLRSEVSAGANVTPGAWIPFHTGMLDGNFTPVSLVTPATSGADLAEPVIIYSAISLSGGSRPFATDLQGRVIWYLRSADSITRVIPGGRFLVLADGMNSANTTREGQILRELDLAGNVIRETNIGIVAEQLEAHGIHSDCHKNGRECVSGFHHEAIRLPNGHTLAVAGIERMMPTGTQGSKLPVDVLGDLVIDLDEDFQVAGVWNSFDHQDLKRKSLNDAKCHTGEGGCPAILLADEANGWLHSNSLNYIPSSGDFLVSQPEQNWVLKIDWKNGKGSGKVLWRLGKDGDFKVESKDPNPWFSFQHDAGFEPLGSDLLTLTDDGDASGTAKKAGVRGQVWKLDEEKHIATLVYNAPLGVGTVCCGSMQLLKNGGYNAVAGWSLPNTGRTTEFDKDGKVVFAVDLGGSIDYRSYRVPDMYSAPVK